MLLCILSCIDGHFDIILMKVLYYFVLSCKRKSLCFTSTNGFMAVCMPLKEISVKTWALWWKSEARWSPSIENIVCKKKHKDLYWFMLHMTWNREGFIIGLANCHISQSFCTYDEVLRKDATHVLVSIRLQGPVTFDVFMQNIFECSIFLLFENTA